MCSAPRPVTETHQGRLTVPRRHSGSRFPQTLFSSKTPPAASSSPAPAAPPAAGPVSRPAPGRRRRDRRPRRPATSAPRLPLVADRCLEPGDRAPVERGLARGALWLPRNRRRSGRHRAGRPSRAAPARRRRRRVGAVSAAVCAASRSARERGARGHATPPDAPPRGRRAPAAARAPAVRALGRRSGRGPPAIRPAETQNAPDPLRPAYSLAGADRGRVRRESLFAHGALLVGDCSPRTRFHGTDAEVLLHACLDFGRHVRVVLQVHLGVLTPLSDSLFAVRVPSA